MTATHEDGLPGPTGNLVLNGKPSAYAALSRDPGAPGQPRPAGSLATTLGTLSSTPTAATSAPAAGGAGSTGGPGHGGRRPAGQRGGGVVVGLRAITLSGARGWFRFCGYRVP
ncbi:MAG TPA: hypothetical protein VEK07_09205 [Polyangiaceae bacterium]|nr:hypothetical protein [Polyangiaceae bacterium]